MLRGIRIILASLFFAACVACLILGPQVHPMARGAESAQIVLSAISVTLGATLVWLLISFVFGRVYCSTACPIGFLSDIFFRIGRKIPRLNRPFSYRHPSRVAPHILWIYILCLLIGIVGIPFLIEPWNMARNIASVFNQSTVAATWTRIGLGAGTGILAGAVSFLFIAVTSLWRGREFCTRYCPLGFAMGCMGDHTLYHIEINPDLCDSCGKCEENCRAQAIKVVSRYVDNSRCVRCFDCTAKCPQGAIRFQTNRNRPATPLMRRKQKGI